MPCGQLNFAPDFCRQSGCQYSPTFATCYKDNLPCSLLSSDRKMCAVDQGDQCEYDDMTGVCHDKGTPVPCASQSLTSNPFLCNYLDHCQYTGSSCAECPNSNCVATSTTTAAPTGSLPADCSVFSDQTECFEAAGCSWSLTEDPSAPPTGSLDPSAGKCVEATCGQIFEPNACLLRDCVWTANTFSCSSPDPGLPCNQLSGSVECSAANLRCSFDFLTSQCVPRTCDTLSSAEQCLSLPTDTCIWDQGSSVCRKQGAPFPCDRLFGQARCDAYTECTWDALVNLCHHDDTPPACSLYATGGQCATQSPRCEFNKVAQSCVAQGTKPQCSQYTTRSGCAGDSSCKYDTIAGVCLNSTDTVQCAVVSRSACEALSTCRWQADQFTCNNCTGPSCVQLAQNDIKACNDTFLATSSCPPEYCTSTFDEPCISAPCRNIAPFFCVATAGCEYDQSFNLCKPLGAKTPCSVYPNQPVCVGKQCKWNAAVQYCTERDEDVPCDIFVTNATCSSAADRCLWTTDLRCVEITTTTTTTTTTPCINGCDNNFNACFSECTPSDCLGNYNCSACPAGFSGDGVTCDQVTCPTSIKDLPANSTHASFFECSFNSYGSTCNLACLRGFEKTAGDFAFTCGQEGEWEGLLTCSDIKECASNPCGPMLSCSEPVVDSFDCGSCPDGYRKVTLASGMQVCEDVNECSRSPCWSYGQFRSACTNTNGSFTCEPCPLGWRGSPLVAEGGCENINECEEGPLDGKACACSENAACYDNDGSFTCSSDCDFGYVGDPTTCGGCVGKPCPATIPNLDANTEVDCSGDKRFGGPPCTVRCKDGYVDANGCLDVTYNCSRLGLWQANGLPLRCREAACGLRIADLPANAVQLTSCATQELDPNAECPVGCAAGFEVQGSITPYSCDARGQWVGGSITCAACAAGKFNALAGTGPCSDVSTCPSRTYQAAPPTPTSDTVCEPLTRALAAQQLRAQEAHGHHGPRVLRVRALRRQ